MISYIHVILQDRIPIRQDHFETRHKLKDNTELIFVYQGQQLILRHVKFC